MTRLAFQPAAAAVRRGKGRTAPRRRQRPCPACVPACPPFSGSTGLRPLRRSSPSRTATRPPSTSSTQTGARHSGSLPRTHTHPNFRVPPAGPRQPRSRCCPSTRRPCSRSRTAPRSTCASRPTPRACSSTGGATRTGARRQGWREGGPTPTVRPAACRRFAVPDGTVSFAYKSDTDLFDLAKVRRWGADRLSACSPTRLSPPPAGQGPPPQSRHRAYGRVLCRLSDGRQGAPTLPSHRRTTLPIRAPHPTAQVRLFSVRSGKLRRVYDESPEVYEAQQAAGEGRGGGEGPRSCIHLPRTCAPNRVAAPRPTALTCACRHSHRPRPAGPGQAPRRRARPPRVHSRGPASVAHARVRPRGTTAPGGSGGRGVGCGSTGGGVGRRHDVWPPARPCRRRV